MAVSGALTGSLGNLYVTNAAEEDDVPSCARAEPTVGGGAGEEANRAWDERGAAVLVRQESDLNGNVVTKVIKKGVRDFSFGRTLGEGSYSTVVAATDRQTLKEYAIKVLDKRHIIKEKKVKYVNIEKNTLNRLGNHPGIVRLYYTFQDERSLYFVLDLAANGELLSFVKKLGSFDEECTRFFAAQILDAVEYMHSRGVIHRDLKPENVLLDDRMRVKITDFGTAKILEPKVQGQPVAPADSRANSFVGTAEYVSPELLTDKATCKASDLWAFGCIVYQLLAGRPPFKASNEYQTFQRIVALDYSFPVGFPTLAQDLVQKLLVADPAKRLAIPQIKAHPFFASIQWGRPLWKRKAPRLMPYRPNGVDKVICLDPTPSPGHLLSQPRTGPANSVPPPSQLDIEWSHVLSQPSERVLKIGLLRVSTSTASPTLPSDSKLSRFFLPHHMPKRKLRRVVLTTMGRLFIVADDGQPKIGPVELLRTVIRTKSHRSDAFVIESVSCFAMPLLIQTDIAYEFEDPNDALNVAAWIGALEQARKQAQHSPVFDHPILEPPKRNRQSKGYALTSVF